MSTDIVVGMTALPWRTTKPLVRHTFRVLTRGLVPWHPQRDSNPCRHLERVVS